MTPSDVRCAFRTVALRCAVAGSDGVIAFFELLSAFVRRARNEEVFNLIVSVGGRHNGGAQPEKHGA